MSQRRITLQALALSGLTALSPAMADENLRFAQAHVYENSVTTELPEYFSYKPFGQRIEMTRAWRAYQYENKDHWDDAPTPPPPNFSYDSDRHDWVLLGPPNGIYDYTFNQRSYEWEPKYTYYPTPHVPADMDFSIEP